MRNYNKDQEKYAFEEVVDLDFYQDITLEKDGWSCLNAYLNYSNALDCAIHFKKTSLKVGTRRLKVKNTNIWEVWTCS